MNESYQAVINDRKITSSSYPICTLREKNTMYSFEKEQMRSHADGSVIIQTGARVCALNPLLVWGSRAVHRISMPRTVF